MKYKVEAFDKMHFFLRYAFEPMIRFRIDFAGFIDIDVLKKAVTLSMNTVPLIRCCFDDSRMEPRWVDKYFTAEDIVHAENVGIDIDSEKQIRYRLSKEIDTKTEPQLMIYIIRKTDSDTLCVIINHMVSDGSGFKQYLYLLSELYTKLKKNQPLPAAAPPPRGIKPLLTGLTLAGKVRIMRTRPDYYYAYRAEKQSGVDFNVQDCKAYLETRIVSKEQFIKLKNVGKDLDATVNDIFLALFLRSFCRITKTEKAKCLSTMDIRRLIPPNIDIGWGIDNYSCHGACIASVKADDPFSVTVKQISEQMGYYKSGSNPLSDIIWWDYITRFIPFRILERRYDKFIRAPILVFSNCGVIDNASLRFDDLIVKNAVLSSAIYRSPYFQLVMSTFNNCCTLSCNFYGDEDSKSWVDRFFDSYLTEIESLV